MRQTFPFLWGAATSSHQIEGGNKANDWWAWEQAGKLKEPSGAACDHFNRFREDFQIISSLGHNAYRLSIEWSRLEPEENRWDEAGFRFYEEIFKELAARKIEPVVTLHHFTNPQWFAERGGWLSDDTVRCFTRFVSKVVERFSPYVRFWITINEPLIYLYHSFFAGLWPPGIRSFDASMTVFRHQIMAHAAAYRQIHHHYESHHRGPVYVSIAKHVSHYTPNDKHSLKDRWSVFMRNWFFNDLFLDASITGFLFFPGIFCEFLPAKGGLDFLGINYYTRDFIQFKSWFGHDFIGEASDKSNHQDQVKELNMMGWEIYPEGLYFMLKRLKRFRLPIMITENGVATLDDTQRIRFIESHLDSVRRAREEGVSVSGFFYWSLLDNFEWAHGFGPRFGIVDVDYRTQQRKIRPSAYVLTEKCRKLSGEN